MGFANNFIPTMNPQVPYSSPLQGTIHLKLRCLMETAIIEKGFLVSLSCISTCSLLSRSTNLNYKARIFVIIDIWKTLWLNFPVVDYFWGREWFWCLAQTLVRVEKSHVVILEISGRWKHQGTCSKLVAKYFCLLVYVKLLAYTGIVEVIAINTQLRFRLHTLKLYTWF